MIIYKNGNILAEKTDAIVNTVNCVGVMGRGIALQFKESYPENFKAYASACKQHEIVPGKVFVYRTNSLENPAYIINFPTKRHWREKSHLAYIDAGLSDLVQAIQKYAITSIAIPPLGCGLGGLQWNDVKPLIAMHMSKLPNLTTLVLEPSSDVGHQQKINQAAPPRMTPGRAVLVKLMQRYAQGLLDPCITLLEVQKLMYFAQLAGEDLRLRFVKAPFGPYAENLRHVLRILDGYMITGYGSGGDSPTKELHILPEIEPLVDSYLENLPESTAHMERVSNLVDGFESPFGLELLATVHWVATQEHIHDITHIEQHLHDWGRQKRQFTSRHIQIAYTTLQDQGWL